MRKLTTEELELVSGGDIGDLVIGSGNGIGTGNSVDVSNIANCNSVLDGSLNGSGNGAGIGNFSLN
jgi:hypothetical protein